MYEGCNKTALTSQSAIAGALLSLMEEKPYSRISVSEICKCAGVSRQTFYTLFESKDNVIAFELERKYCFRPEEHECCRSSMSLEDICHAYSIYITECRDILALLDYAVCYALVICPVGPVSLFEDFQQVLGSDFGRVAGHNGGT